VPINRSKPQSSRDVPPSVSRTAVRAPKGFRCSFCQADIENLGPRESAANGLFCSTRCRECVLALSALHPSPLAPYEFVERRVLLADQLLDLWRSNRGPDPALVLQAARKAGHGLVFALD
jgi:hypothetical protein